MTFPFLALSFESRFYWYSLDLICCNRFKLLWFPYALCFIIFVIFFSWPPILKPYSGLWEAKFVREEAEIEGYRSDECLFWLWSFKYTAPGEKFLRDWNLGSPLAELDTNEGNLCEEYRSFSIVLNFLLGFIFLSIHDVFLLPNCGWEGRVWKLK